MKRSVLTSLRRIRRLVRGVGGAVDRVLISTCRRFGFLAGLYYIFCNRAFHREQRSFLEGKHRYLQSLKNPDERTSPLLRRNTHRLEKGLLMQPRREVFALEYIAETVACYERLIKSTSAVPDGGNSELQWAHDVLAEYFAVTASDPTINAVRDHFAALESHGNGHEKLIPYRRNVGSEPPVTYEELLALAKRRRSVRWFRQVPVPRELIDRAIAVAAQSPSACNRQPFVFRIFDEPFLVQKVATIPGGTPGFVHNIPMIAVVVGQLRNYPFERDRHLIYVDGALASMSFILALEAQGLSSCCINWPDVEVREKRMASLLRLEPDERPIMCIAVGYPDPDGLVAYSQKKPLGQLRRYN